MAELGLPAGTEALDPIMPQYLSELITWTAIGARTTESQTHREMASGLSTPVGFKNGTDGALATSINALESVRHPHHFLGITQQGQSAVFRTRGNPHAHLVLRGGGGRVNYDAVSIALAERQLAQANLPTNIVVDCSHGNSNKDPSVQPLVAENCVTQILDGNRSIVGLMLESHLKAGNQPIPKDLSTLEYGVSITDPCMDWQSTEALLLKLHALARDPPPLARTIHERGNSRKKAGSDRHFPDREKQDVFPEASMDGFTAFRKMPVRSRLCLRKYRRFMNSLR